MVSLERKKRIKKRQKELDKVTKFFNSFFDSIEKLNYEPRSSMILYHVMIEHYIDRILEIKYKTSLLNDIRYEKKTQLLQECKVIDKENFEDLQTLYSMRNIFAHQNIIHERMINDLLGKIQSIRNVKRFEDLGYPEKLLKYLSLFESRYRNKYVKAVSDDMNKTVRNDLD